MEILILVRIECLAHAATAEAASLALERRQTSSQQVSLTPRFSWIRESGGAAGSIKFESIPTIQFILHFIMDSP
jgi:hypothetical protein